MHHLAPKNPGLPSQVPRVCSLFIHARYRRLAAFLPALLLMHILSCTPAKKTFYFQNLPKDTTLQNLVNKDFETKIQKSDLLSIAVASLSPDVSIYNAPQNTSGALSGYLVDSTGNINFIKLGKIHVVGLTKPELKVMLENALVPYLKEAVVGVGIINRHVTMLGAAGSKILPLDIENMTILDALASTGDIGNKGKTDNILVIREKGQSKEFNRLNLTDQSVFYSPYFYLMPNDIIYVEPAKPKVNRTSQIISYISVGLSLVFLLINQVFK